MLSHTPHMHAHFDPVLFERFMCLPEHTRRQLIGIFGHMLDMVEMADGGGHTRPDSEPGAATDSATDPQRT